MSAEMETLAARVEMLDGPDRDVDALIAPLQGLRIVDEGHPLGRCCYDQNGALVVLPSYTRSLDAAMSLVPNDADERATFWKVGNDGEGGDPSLFKATVLIATGFTSKTYSAVADTAPLALCAAALRARPTTTGESGL